MFATMKRMTAAAVVISGFVFAGYAKAEPAGGLDALMKQMNSLRGRLVQVESELITLGQEARDVHAMYIEAMGLFNATGEDKYWDLSREAVRKSRNIAEAYAQASNARNKILHRIKDLADQIEALQHPAAPPTLGTSDQPAVTVHQPSDPGTISPSVSPVMPQFTSADILGASKAGAP